MEAEIMFDVIGKTLMDRSIKLLTIHDAILVNNDEDCSTVIKIMQDAFITKFSSVPPIEVEPC
jgi:hypothetical protein